eukprot:520258-Heterocapsa_arctica.AAC.1
MVEAPMSRKEAMIQFNNLGEAGEIIGSADHVRVQGQQEARWKRRGIPGPGQGSIGDEHEQGGGEDHHRLDRKQPM